MAKTLEKIFEQKLQVMPPEEYAIDPSQKGRKVKPAKKMKGVCSLTVKTPQATMSMSIVVLDSCSSGNNIRKHYHYIG